MTGRHASHGPATLLWKRLVRNVFLGLWLLAFGAAEPRTAVAKNAASSSAGLRYVLLVDTSVHMTGQKDALAQAITEKIASGFDGEANPGEMFVLWPFSSGAWTNAFLPVTWAPRTKELYAKRMGRAVEDQAFSGSSSLRAALEAAASLIPSADHLTLYIFTDGTVPMSGTPFDQPINGCYAQAARLSDGASALLLTTLVAQGGSLVRWSVAKLATGSSLIIQPTPEPPTPRTAATPSAAPRPARTTQTISQLAAAAPPRVLPVPVAAGTQHPSTAVILPEQDSPRGDTATEIVLFADGLEWGDASAAEPAATGQAALEHCEPPVSKNRSEPPAGSPASIVASSNRSAEHRHLAMTPPPQKSIAPPRGGPASVSSDPPPDTRPGGNASAAPIPSKHGEASLELGEAAVGHGSPWQFGRWLYLASGLSLLAVGGYCLAKSRASSVPKRSSSLISQSFDAGTSLRSTLRRSSVSAASSRAAVRPPETEPALVEPRA